MSNNDIAEKIEILKANRDFDRVSEENIRELAIRSVRMFYKKGEYIFHAGDSTEYFYSIESGFVFLSKDSPSGKSVAFALLERGYTLNAVTCFKPSPRYFSARAVDNVSILAIPRWDFKEWALKNPQVTESIICTLGDLLDAAYHRLLELVNESVEQRIVNTLSVVSSRMGTNLPLTNNDLADLIGTTGETTTRVITRLQKSGLLAKSRGKITITDPLQLHSLSSSSAIFI